MRTLILQHEEPTPPGLITGWLNKLAADFVVLRIDLVDSLPDPRDYDLVISLGSEYGAYDDSIPFIKREVRLLHQAAEADVPILGICFGGQLLATVLGGHAHRAERCEIGWLPIRSTVPELVPEGPWFTWHFDTFTLPPGARLIADTDVGPQAFSLGKSLGLQFHPEVTSAIIAQWVRVYRHEIDAAGVDPKALMEDTRHHQKHARISTENLLNLYLQRIARPNNKTASDH